MVLAVAAAAASPSFIREPLLLGCKLRIAGGHCPGTAAGHRSWFTASADSAISVTDCRHRQQLWQQRCGSAARVEVQLPTQRVAAAEQIGYGEAATTFCLWLSHAPGCSLNESACIERGTAAVAQARSVSVAQLRARTLRRCLHDHVLGQPPSSPVTVDVERLGGACAAQTIDAAGGEVWLLAIVRMQSRHLACARPRSNRRAIAADWLTPPNYRPIHHRLGRVAPLARDLAPAHLRQPPRRRAGGANGYARSPRAIWAPHRAPPMARRAAAAHGLQLWI